MLGTMFTPDRVCLFGVYPAVHPLHCGHYRGAAQAEFAPERAETGQVPPAFSCAWVVSFAVYPGRAFNRVLIADPLNEMSYMVAAGVTFILEEQSAGRGGVCMV